MPLDPALSRVALAADFTLCRVLNGMWQVSGAHGQINPHAAVQEMLAYHAEGFTSWDLADHYGPAEDFIGQYRRQLKATLGEAALSDLQALTKWVPRPGRMTRRVVEEAIQVALRRMDTPTLDLLQFHWWKYTDPNYLEALVYLTQLRTEGKIRHLGLTNFDTDHLQTIVERGFKVVTNQVQFSLIDRRPEIALLPFCATQNIQVLAYGTLCGGFLTDTYLNQPEPRLSALNTASQWKYKQMIDQWGGWELFQQLLRVLRQVADKYQVSIANVAVRYILDKPMVAGVIVGARLGLSQHRTDNAQVFNFALDHEDAHQLQTVLARARDLYKLIGDCGAEYRH